MNVYEKSEKSVVISFSKWIPKDFVINARLLNNLRYKERLEKVQGAKLKQKEADDAYEAISKKNWETLNAQENE